MEKVLDLAIRSLNWAFASFAIFPSTSSFFSIKYAENEPTILAEFTNRDGKVLFYRCSYPAEWQGLSIEKGDRGKTIGEVLRRFSANVSKRIPAFSGVPFATVVPKIEILIELVNNPYGDKKSYTHMGELRDAWIKELEAKVL